MCTALLCTYSFFYVSPLFCMKGRFGAEWHLPDLQCQQRSSATLCIADSPSSDLGNRGPASCFYLSPLFHLRGIQPNTQFHSSVFLAQLRCCINLGRGPVSIALRLLYRLFTPSGCRSIFFHSTVYGLCGWICVDLSCLYLRGTWKDDKPFPL